MTLTRIHLLDSDIPLQEGKDRTSVCGKTVKSARWAFMWDEQQMGYPILEFLTADCEPQSICPACLDVELERDYVYGLIPGQAQELPIGDMAGAGF